MIKVSLCLPRSIRVKLNSSCQYQCKFCHQEGNAVAKNVTPKELLPALLVLKKSLGFYRVHFTGGEPTLYKNFEELLHMTKEAGFSNALTSNGQFVAKNLSKLKNAGLDSINFSLHTLNVNKFLKMQNVQIPQKAANRWAEDCIKKTVNNILSANAIIPTKINCVVSDDIDSSQEVLNLAIKHKIPLRFLNDLSLGELSLNNIDKLLQINKAQLIGHEITLLSSSHRLDYKIGNYNFGVKCIRDFYLHSMCDNCDYKNSNNCLEKYYGIRLEDDPLKIRLCLNKNIPPYIQNINDFLEGNIFSDMVKLTSKMNEYIKMDSTLIKQKKEEILEI